MTAPLSAPSPACSPLESLLGLSPLVPGEDAAAYEALRSTMFAALSPTDAIEALWAKSLVDGTWELQRLERVRTHILDRSRQALLRTLLYGNLKPKADAHKRVTAIVTRYLAGEPAAAALVEPLLAQKGYDSTLLVTHAYQANLPTLLALDGLCARTELRRTRLLREIDRRRHDFARRARAATRSSASRPAEAAGDLAQARPPAQSSPPPAPAAPPAGDRRFGRRPDPDEEEDGVSRSADPARREEGGVSGSADPAPREAGGVARHASPARGGDRAPGRAPSPAGGGVRGAPPLPGPAPADAAPPDRLSWTYDAITSASSTSGAPPQPHEPWPPDPHPFRRAGDERETD